MSDPYIGEIRIFAGNFAPVGWAFCDGATIAISENDTLFNLIGTTYGGDGQQTFNLPDLRGRVPVHQGTGAGATYVLGQSGGVEQVTLTVQQTRAHSHSLFATTAIGSQAAPGGNVLANSQGPQPFIEEDPDADLDHGTLSSVGGSQPHDNMQPYLGVNFIISLFGIFPTQS